MCIKLESSALNSLQGGALHFFMFVAELCASILLLKERIPTTCNSRHATVPSITSLAEKKRASERARERERERERERKGERDFIFSVNYISDS